MMSLKSFCVTPRMENWVFCPAKFPEIWTPGEKAAISKLSDTPSAFICRPVKALIAIGTSCRFCSRFCATTTTSSSTLWASTGLVNTALATAVASVFLRMEWFMSVLRIGSVKTDIKHHKAFFARSV